MVSQHGEICILRSIYYDHVQLFMYLIHGQPLFVTPLRATSHNGKEGLQQRLVNCSRCFVC